MFAAFFDHRWTIDLLLGFVALTLTLIWLRTRNRRAAMGTAVAVGLLVLFEMARLIHGETAGEQIVRKTHAMADAVRAKDVDAIFRHISDRFILGAADKAAFRHFGEVSIRDNEIQAVAVQNFGEVQFTAATVDQPARAQVEFAAFVQVKYEDFEGKRPLRVVAQYVLDADREWRLLTFDVFDGANTTPLPIPHLPAR